MNAKQFVIKKSKSIRAFEILKETEEEVRRYGDALSTRMAEMQKMAAALPQIPRKTTFTFQNVKRSIQKQSRKVFRTQIWMNETQLAEFANGSMAACFGDEYLIYEDRRHPRIPRGELMLMSRIDKVIGERHQLNQSAEIYAAYDIPAQAWFGSEHSKNEIALAGYLEMALQPCGVLSAHLGTSLVHPEIDFYFRNLDGELTFFELPDLSGETINVYGKMTSTVVGADTILQRFDFSLSMDERLILSGNTVFGYFHPKAMAAQRGMESVETHQFPLTASEPLPVAWIHQRHGEQRALMIKEATLYAAKANPQTIVGLYEIDANDWFFKAHFLHDPVMPGSLGIEAATQLMELYAINKYAGYNPEQLTFTPVTEEKVSWKYRGQILPDDNEMLVKVFIIDEIPDALDPNEVKIIASAEVWKDTTKIYEISNIQYLAKMAEIEHGARL
ncbi:MAG: hypothetical protein JEZ00_07605 [Anaerolineaceae bacterium]|nr:hypothetical protein [Anaerolineaceae bacterium]